MSGYTKEQEAKALEAVEDGLSGRKLPIHPEAIRIVLAMARRKAKRKAKTAVTHAVQWSDGGEWRSDLIGSEFKDKRSSSLHARMEAQRSGLRHRVVRVERTVVAEVKP